MTRTLLLAAAVLLAVIGGLAAWEAREAYITNKAEERGYDRAIALITERELEAEKRGRDEERRQTEAARKEAHEAHKKLNLAVVAMGNAKRAGIKLREQLEVAYALRCTSADPAPAAASTPANPTSDLLADVRRRLDEATDGTIGFADAAHIAGTACERTHDSLTIK